jgi:hypothetical protein
LPIDLVGLAIDDAWRGDFAGAASRIAECDAVCEVTGGSRVSPFAAMFLGALRGNQAEVIPLIEAALGAQTFRPTADSRQPTADSRGSQPEPHHCLHTAA